MPLTYAQLAARLTGKFGAVYFCWFKPEIERHPETAWRIRCHGWTSIERGERTGRLRTGVSRQYIKITKLGHIVNENAPIGEEGFEVDGRGFVYLFNSPKERAQYVEDRRRAFAAESASLFPAIINNLRRAIRR